VTNWLGEQSRLGSILGSAWIVLAALHVPAAGAEQTNFDGQRARAYALLQSGEANEAADIFESLLENDPEDSVAIEGRIRSLLRLQRWRSALEESRRHAAALPERPRVQSVFAETLFRAGRLEEVEQVVGVIAARENPPARALAILGRLRGAEGREGDAVALMARAVAAAPDDRDVLYWASGFTSTRGEAVRRLETYLELAEGDDGDRIEAARSGVEVLRSLGERAIWVSEVRPERTEIPLSRIWDPATGMMQGYLIRAGLGENRKTTPLLLDTGSPGLFVIRRVARKRGFAVLAEQSQFGGGGDRRHRSERGIFPTATIGELRFSEALASSNKQEMDLTGRYHGLIGLAAFNGYRITLDLENDKLLLEPPGEVAEGEPYWTVEGQWLVRGTVGGEGCLLLLDTGATHTAVDRSTAERTPGVRLGAAVSVQGFGGQVEGARRVQGIEIAYQGLGTGAGPMNALDLSTRSSLGGVELCGFVGLDLLSGKRIVIDTAHRRINVR
jgi:tetratricopeptide (TPR) repeat protein